MSRSAAVILILLTAGCTGNQAGRDKYPLMGFVCGSRSDIVQSYMLSRLGSHEDGEPLADAEVLLTSGNTGQNPLPGCRTKTGADGRYTMPSDGVPLPASSDYFLIVRKTGYEPLTIRVAFGVFSQYLENCVIMKPNKD